MHYASTKRVYQATYVALCNPAFSLERKQVEAQALKGSFPEFAHVIHSAMLGAMRDYIPPHMEERLVKCKTIKDVLATL